MRSLIAALITVILTSIVLMTMQVDQKQTNDAVGMQKTIMQSEAAYAAVRAAYMQQISTAMQTCATNYPPPAYGDPTSGTLPTPTPCTPITAATFTTQPNSTVTLAGDTRTETASQDATTSNNADVMLREQRVALNITYGAPGLPSVSHEVILRAFAYSPYVQILSDAPLGNSSDFDVVNATDVGGCYSTGYGCNSDVTSQVGQTTQQASTATAQLNCNANTVGSGICPASSWDASNYQSSAVWSNMQYQSQP